MDAPQLDLFDDLAGQVASFGKVVLSRSIDLGSFGNLCLLIVVEGTSVRAVTHLECSDPGVKYFNYLS